MDNSNNDRVGNLSNLFSNFIREREMLYGARPATIRFYRKGWAAFEKWGLPTPPRNFYKPGPSLGREFHLTRDLF